MLFGVYIVTIYLLALSTVQIIYSVARTNSD